NVKLLGLTATPTRTGDERSGNNILGKIFTDGVRKGKVVKGKVGITYDISLKELLNRQILATPHFEHYETEQEYGEQLGLDAW
ncbi:MAG: helicase, partial [Planctomycetia bacterium]|nr:helicase [Planctomycetia bacterium]